MSNPDYLIIGSGIAGLNFALNAAKHGKVLIVTKKNTVTTNTNLAQGGIAAVLSKLDDFQKHIKDTLEAGARHNNTKAVEFLIKNGPEAIYKLAKIGVPFSTDNQGKLLLTKEGGHSERRIAFVGDYTGAAIEKTLMEKTAKNPLWRQEESVNYIALPQILQFPPVTELPWLIKPGVKFKIWNLFNSTPLR